MEFGGWYLGDFQRGVHQSAVHDEDLRVVLVQVVLTRTHVGRFGWHDRHR